MKTILLSLLFAAGVTGCYTAKEIEVEMVQAQLIRIDTVSPHPDQKQNLTWRDQDDNDYVSYEPMYVNYLVGSRMLIMRRR